MTRIFIDFLFENLSSLVLTFSMKWYKQERWQWWQNIFKLENENTFHIIDNGLNGTVDN